jgi:DNA-binding LytR/AlgR family response regulator
MAGLKENSKRVLDIIATQKDRNATAAYMQVHPNSAPNTAQVNAAQLLAKPTAQLYLESHINKAKETIVSLMDSEKPDIQLRAATDVLDRSQGKAVQQIQQTTTGVTLTIDLTSALAQDSPQ